MAEMTQFEAELDRFDWGQLRTFGGCASELPALMRSLASAPDPGAAQRWGQLIAGEILSQDCPSQACLAVATCLVAVIPDCTIQSRALILDILAQIGSSHEYAPESGVGQVDVARCAGVIGEKFDVYCDILAAENDAPERLICIDLISLCGYYNSGQRQRALRVLRDALSVKSLATARELIVNSIDDIASAEGPDLLSRTARG